ncbi:exonuclease SbcCD subunit D [Erysipelothrix urinaevulpis]|uniref:exonuclease SbcCD subunit D n=1 Tax=Erysipelothrix urinaevulpis TaxID=2683717 RepID=UPI00135CEDA3|nr:exonuclease SbcCD subunit D [Erysipelothrix urinaevulpis]
MKLAHIADLHIGRKLGEYDLYEEQRDILQQLITIFKEENIDGVMISGDVYDKNSPSEKAFSLWNDFLSDLHDLDIHVFVISGNHDSQERLGVGHSILRKEKIHIVSDYQGKLVSVQIEDEYGPINIYMMPFIKPSFVRNVHTDYTESTHHSAVKRVLRDCEVNQDERNILMAHQFVVSGELEPELSDSEIGPMVGGIDSVNASLFDAFDYVALGHIHRPQRIHKDTIRYAGTPLKYSFSEVSHKKTVPILNITNTLEVFYRPLQSLRDVRVLEGTFDDIYLQGLEEKSDDLIHVILTDDHLSYNPIGRLRNVYPNLLTMELKNNQQNEQQDLQRAEGILEMAPFELISTFFKQQNERSLSDEEKDYLISVLEGVDEE